MRWRESLAGAASWLQSASRKPGAARTTWGDGWVENVSFCWSVSWQDVTPDELAFLMPALVSRDLEVQTSTESIGPLSILREVSATRLWALAERRVLAHCRTRLQSIEACQLKRIVDPATLTRALQLEASDIGPLGFTLEQTARAEWADDVAALEVIEFACRYLSRKETSERPGLREGVLLSLHGGLNAAYVYRHLDWAHELLLVAAWIGHVSRGRPAWLTRPIAECLVDIMGRPKGALRGIRDLGAAQEIALLHREIEAACPVSALAALAQRIVAGAEPRIVYPQSRGRVHARQPNAEQILRAGQNSRMGGTPRNVSS